jgi:hypothetical protein
MFCARTVGYVAGEVLSAGLSSFVRAGQSRAPIGLIVPHDYHCADCG